MKSRDQIQGILRRGLVSALRFLVASLSFAVGLYVLFALLFSTEEERRLQKENRLYRQRYTQMLRQQRLMADVAEGLVLKDEGIYRELFHTGVPAADPGAADPLIPISDSLSEGYYVKSVAAASADLLQRAAAVDSCFHEVFHLLKSRRDSIPPLTLPLHGLSYVQTGASLGLKDNPVYHIQVQHNGLDLVAPQGIPVYAAAAGVVSKVVHSRKGLGNIVEIDHGNGYVTRYCLMGDILVPRGRRVRRDQQIGTVGISPTLPAPHLHFEVLHRGRPCDPVHYLFASLSPEEYARMLHLSQTTSQSMD